MHRLIAWCEPFLGLRISLFEFAQDKVDVELAVLLLLELDVDCGLAVRAYNGFSGYPLQALKLNHVFEPVFLIAAHLEGFETERVGHISSTLPARKCLISLQTGSNSQTTNRAW